MTFSLANTARLQHTYAQNAGGFFFFFCLQMAGAPLALGEKQQKKKTSRRQRCINMNKG